MHGVLFNHLFKLAQEKVWLGELFPKNIVIDFLWRLQSCPLTLHTSPTFNQIKSFSIFDIRLLLERKNRKRFSIHVFTAKQGWISGKNWQILLKTVRPNFKWPSLQIIYFKSSFCWSELLRTIWYYFPLVYFVKAIHLKEHYIFVIFQGGGGGGCPDPLSPSGSAHELNIFYLFQLVKKIAAGTQKNHLKERFFWVCTTYVNWAVTWDFQNVVCGTIKASDQPGHMHSLTRAFDSCLNILPVLRYGPNIIWSF